MTKRKSFSSRRDSIYRLTLDLNDISSVVANYDHHYFIGRLDNVLDIKTQDITATASNNKNIIIGLKNGNIEIYDLKSQLLATLFGHKKEITCIAVLGDLIVSGSRDATVRIWNPYCIKVLAKNYGSCVTALEVVKDKIIAGFYDGTIKIYDKYYCPVIISVSLSPITYIKDCKAYSETSSCILDLETYGFRYVNYVKPDKGIKLQDGRFLTIKDGSLNVNELIFGQQISDAFLLSTGKVLTIGPEIQVWK